MILVVFLCGMLEGTSLRRFGIIGKFSAPTKRVSFKTNCNRLDISTILTSDSTLEGYINFWVDTYKSLHWSVPEPILHWGHAVSMTTVLLAMGGIGTFLGLQIRNGNGSASYPFTLGKTAREQHPLIMGLAFLFFLLGGQGGLVLLALEGKPILESPHATTALIGISLLAIQVKE
jgi:hypothetical protein